MVVTCILFCVCVWGLLCMLLVVVVVLLHLKGVLCYAALYYNSTRALIICYIGATHATKCCPQDPHPVHPPHAHRACSQVPLFIGVVVSSMEEAVQAQKQAKVGTVYNTLLYIYKPF